MKPITSLGAVIAVLVATLAWTALPASAQTAGDPESIVRGAIDAFNRGDAVASAAYFSEDTTVTGLCQPAGVCHGRAELQAAIEEEVAHRGHDDILSLTVSGSVVTMQIAETFPDFVDLGIGRIIINITATVENGLITEFTDELDLADSQTATFVAAMEGEEPSNMPAAGTGYAPSSDESWLLYATGLLVTGVLATFAAWAVRPRRRA